MAFPIGWIIVSAIAGAAAVVFWERIKEWATRVVGLLVDGINLLVEVIGGGIVSFIKEGRKFYKTLDLYTKDIETQKYYRRELPKEELKASEVPPDFLNNINENEKMPVLKLQT